MNEDAKYANERDELRKSDFQAYIHSIAEARFVIRRVLRILDDQVREHALEPLLHQSLLQVYGADEPITVSALAGRLDVAAAFASRLVRQLEEIGLVERNHSAGGDKRVTLVTATPLGIEKLRAIDHSVHDQIAYFHRQFRDEQKLGALSTFAFYVGLNGSFLAKSPNGVANQQ